MMSFRRCISLSVVALTASTFVPISTAKAQCAATANGYQCWGIDVNGSAGSRATNVNALAARNAFFSNLIGVGTETFESFGAGAAPPLAINFGAAGTATINGTGQVTAQGPGTNGFGRYPISGTKFYAANSGTSQTVSDFRLDFSAPVAAFGFYGIDLGDFNSNISLRFTLAGGGTFDWTLPYTVPAPDGNIQYAGIIDNRTFTSVEFLATAGTSTGDFFAFDDFSIGALEQVVPEPSSLALLLVGVTGLGGVVARRRRRNA